MGLARLSLVVVALATALAGLPAAAQPATAEVPSAVAALREGGDSRIVVVDEDGTTRVLTTGHQDVAPVPAPDGARAAFLRLADAEATDGRLGVVDLDSGGVTLTEISVDRTVPLLWEDAQSLVTTTEHGIVRIHVPSRSVTFTAGTAAGQIAHDLRPDGRAILASRTVDSGDGLALQLIELVDGQAPTVLWSSSDYTVATAAYGPAGGIAFISTVSSTGFGTVQHVRFMDPQGDTVQDALYGGDGPVSLFSGPFWHPAGGAVLFAGAGRTRFPSQETEPATLLAEGPGEARDRTVVTRPDAEHLHALGWRPDASASVAIEDDPDSDAALLVLDAEGAVVRRVALPGDLVTRENAARFGIPEAALLPAIRRVAGVTRVETAVEISQETFPFAAAAGGGQAERVVLARSDAYADALAGAPLARHLDAPLLLTPPDALHEATADEIERLGAGEAVLLGGEAALAPQVARDLEQRGLAVRRVAGADRYATAAAVAAELPPADRVVLVQGAHPDPERGWPDAVSAAPLAAATAIPLLLTLAEDLPEPTARALRERTPGTVTVIGGPAAVSEAVADEAAAAAGGTVQRLAGATRIGTAVAVAQAQSAEHTGSAASLWVATAANWPDALTAGPAVAAHGGVLLLAPAQPGESEMVEFLRATQTRVVRLVGGAAVVGGAQLRLLLRSDGLGGPAAQPIDV